MTLCLLQPEIPHPLPVTRPSMNCQSRRVLPRRAMTIKSRNLLLRQSATVNIPQEAQDDPGAKPLVRPRQPSHGTRTCACLDLHMLVCKLITEIQVTCSCKQAYLQACIAAST